MSTVDIYTVRCEALFVSALQRSDRPTPTDVRLAIRRTVRAFGTRGCAAWVAQEFGDHPELAVERMRWVRQLVEEAVSNGRRPQALRIGRRTVTGPADWVRASVPVLEPAS
jgi:hypothetical protein